MSFRCRGRLAAVLFLMAICVAFGQVYRPVVIPTSLTPPNPGSFHQAFSLNVNAPYNAGSAFQIDVQRIRKDGSTDSAPVAFVLPFIGPHPGPATTQPAAAPAMPGMEMSAGPHEHSFLFNVGPEIYDATGKEAAVEIAVTASTRWVKTSTDPAPTISGLELDLTLTEYAWT